MKTLEELRKRISSVSDMNSVVTTMKTLAAASIRQYEAAAHATRKFDDTIQMALQILFRNRDLSPATTSQGRTPRGNDSRILGFVVFGSDQGLCGRFNEEIAGQVQDYLKTIDSRRLPLTLTVGSRVNHLLEDLGLKISKSFNVPSSVPDITRVLQDLMPQIESWQSDHQDQRIVVFYNRRTSTATYTPSQHQLLPFDPGLVKELKQRDWQSRSLPIHTLPWQSLFSQVIQQYLFLQLFRACAESRASENASRIASMQQAEKNIEKKLVDLEIEFNQQRQNAITEELMDIMSGFEVVSGNQSKSRAGSRNH